MLIIINPKMTSVNFNRVPFCNQKYIYILFHYTAEDLTGLKIIQGGMREILTVAAGLSGASRIPGIGIGIMGTPFYQLLPMTAVKGCLDSILQKIEKIVDIPLCEYDENSLQLLEGCIPFIVKAVTDFSNANNDKMKLIVFTWDAADSLMAGIASYINEYQPLGVSSAKVYQVQDLLGGESLQIRKVPDPIETKVGLQVMGDFLQLDPFSVRVIFKEWLIETPGKNAHAVLSFKEDETNKAIYFDVHECAIDPLLLPSAIASRLSFPLNNIRITTTTSGHFVNTAELEAIRRLNVSSLSANWHHGPFLYLVPSAAQVLSFEDFWENSQRVYSLCQQLESKEEALLCRRISSCGPGSPLTVQAHYIIVAFNKALTLMQLIPHELILIETFSPFYCEAPKKFQNQIDDVMRGLEKSDFQIEHLSESSLTPALINHLSRTPRGTCRPLKPMDTTAASSPPPPAGHPAIRRGGGASRRGVTRRGDGIGPRRGESVMHPCYEDARNASSGSGWC